MRALWVAFVLSFTLTLVLLGGVAMSAYAETIPLELRLANAAALGGTPRTQVPAGTPEPSPVITLTHTLTPEAQTDGLVLLSLTNPLTVTITITPTLTPTPTQDTWFNYLPLILKPIPLPPPPEPRKLLVCSSPNLSIPDNNATGKTDTMTLNDPGQVVDVRTYVWINHTWVSDLTASLEHGGLTSTLFDRPGIPASTYGCELDNIRAIFDDGMAHTAENTCFNSYFAPAIGGSFYPAEPLRVFFNQPAGGTWGLRVVDESMWDYGTLLAWCLDLTVLDGTPTPTPVPTPVTLPTSASVSGMSGQNQKYPLDCESRSAVDWARHWGVSINEDVFFWGLPTSVNPETGFVGNVNGIWGQVPPADYGVHAAPIAARLREYGLQAQARKYMRWDDLRAEIAAGRPVIVWIIDTIAPGAPRYYNPGVGPYTVTAPYEHTMVLTGYSANTVTLLDGATIRTLSLSSFLDSWSALANMGVVYVP